MTVPVSAGASQTRSRSLGKRVTFVTGAIIAMTGIAMLPAVVVAALYRESQTAGLILASSAIGLVVGLGSLRWAGTARELTVREGFLAVGVSWIAMCIVGTLPYLLTGAFASVTDAFFEAVAGFTTTGATTLADPGALPHGVLFWRSTTQWLGGMAVLILSIIVLPMLGVGGVQIGGATAQQATPDRLTPRYRDTAKRLAYIYCASTAFAAVLLTVGDMSLFQAINHALTTLSTGGFSTEASSISGFSTYTQWVITAFMFIGGASFVLHLRALKQPLTYRKSAEFLLYGFLALGGTAIIAGGLSSAGEGTAEAIRHAAFTTVSVVSTTGHTTADFGVWRPVLQVLIIGLMFLGGMAGSTAGSVKTFRVGILAKAATADLRRLIHSRGVFVTRFGREKVRPGVVESVQTFFLFYMFIFMTATFLLSFIDANMSEELNLVTTGSAVAASLGNIGPGLGDVGPAGNYSGIPDLGKWLLAGVMIVGRLEIFPILVLFTRDVWKR